LARHEAKWDSDIDTSVPPSGDGCVECEASGSWWFHLRRCVACGHIGCCDDSLNKHATAHAMSTHHRYIQSYEPGEDWFWDYRDDTIGEGPTLAAPHAHPDDQTTPGPAERVPSNWQQVLQDAER
jgi:hypothetical protein